MGKASIDPGPLRARVTMLARQRGEFVDDDDIADVAHLASERALRRWRPDGGASIATFAWHLVERAYIDIMVPRRNEVPMSTAATDFAWLRNIDEAYAV